MSISIESGFKDLIVSLLKRGELMPRNIEKYTQPYHMVSFRSAFIHRSYDPTNNYELMEFLGDARIDSIIAKYIHRRFPEIKKEGVLAKIKHKLKSGKQLGQFGHDLGFFRFVKFSPEPKKKNGAFASLVKTHFRNMETEDVTSDMVRVKLQELQNSSDDFMEEIEEYTAFTEDVFEAFIGTVMEVIDKEEPDGVAEVVTYNIVVSLLDTVDIELTREWVSDPISRLKEMLFDVKAREGKGWNFSKSLEYYYDVNTGEHKSVIYWYPKGDETANFKNRMKLSEGRARSKKLAGKRAAAEAIRQLKTTYRYTEKPLYIN